MWESRRAYGTCQECGRRYQLRLAGVIRTHWQGDRRCRGSGQVSAEQWAAALASSRRLLKEWGGGR